MRTAIPKSRPRFQKTADNPMWLLLGLPSTTFTTVAHQSSSIKLRRRQPTTTLTNSRDPRSTELKSRFEQWSSAQKNESTKIANYMYTEKIFSSRNLESKIADSL
ncbi:hypothetical protein B9Z55_028168 [Caenorhabditis nigoni]|uniref:Uncharacterized protein n=1 Tax=Caenorhabditis nigoni TaxID=1611254 RepID=A0A2G5SCK3_9PELO|nr:hypothetical protein B9Z55_028168 [Caenorhabditis nigoni]